MTEKSVNVERRNIMKELVGKIAVVTGGASGIGKGIAKKLLENGAEVVIADINKDKLEYAKKELEQNGKK